MKKTLIALALGLASASSFAAVETATANPQWQGTVPASTIGGDFENFEIQLETGELANGTLTFSNDGLVKFVSSSAVKFKVVQKADKTPVDHKVSLTTVAVGVDTLPTPQTTEYFNILNNGTKLVKGATAVQNAAADGTTISVTANDIAGLNLEAGQDVVVQAALTVEAGTDAI